MAATGWNFLVEFGGDAESLLRSIQFQAFGDGRYQIPVVELEFLDEIEFFEVSEDERHELAEQYGLWPMVRLGRRIGFERFVPWCKERMDENNVDTLDELRAMQCLSSGGTHSPLDIFGVAEEQTDFRLFPLRDDQIVRAFGTTLVAYDNVAALEMYIARSVPNAYARWQAVFVPVYTDDRVTHAYVEGATGD